MALGEDMVDIDNKADLAELEAKEHIPSVSVEEEVLEDLDSKCE